MSAVPAGTPADLFEDPVPTPPVSTPVDLPQGPVLPPVDNRSDVPKAPAVAAVPKSPPLPGRPDYVNACAGTASHLRFTCLCESDCSDLWASTHSSAAGC